MTESIIRLNPPSLPDAGAVGYSQISIVEPGRMAHVSGQVARRPGGGPVPADLVEQIGVVVTNLNAALEAVGATPQDIVIARCYVTDLTPERLSQLFPPLLEFFGGVQPCITGIGVAALAEPELQVEVELTLRLPDWPGAPPVGARRRGRRI